MIGAFWRWANKPLDRGKAFSAFLINQFATPGLGSLIAGRRLAGAGQLLLACTGFGLFTAWFIRTISIYYSLMFIDAPTAEPNLHHGLWQAGVVLFGAAWLWALVTSLSLLRQAGRGTPLRADHIPPKIGGPPAEVSGKP